MELKPVETNIDSFGLKKEQSFSMSQDDQGMIFELLRSKMYADPAGSICREVASNSRDANREVGKGTTPIKISIISPNEMFNISDLSISFEDEGPGISPQRMTDVFLKYAASTKRSTNTFTGGFGLGAKTPFAYTDIFHIITVSEGVKYHYLAYIDETRVGKVSQLSTAKTTEVNGTKIIVPIQPKDRQRFEQSVITATTFWDVKPVLKNFTASYPSYSTILTTPSGSKVIQQNNRNNDYDNSSYIACIDGIAYRLKTDMLKLQNLNDNSLKIVIPFPNGILNISSNRETLQYDEETIKTLIARISEVAKEIATKINDKISSAPDNFKALVIYKDIKGHSGNDDNKLYGVFNTINKTNSLNFNYKGLDLHKFDQNDFFKLGFFYYDSHNIGMGGKPATNYRWNSTQVLKNPIYFNDGVMDSRRIETLKNLHTYFTIVNMPKCKFGRHDRDKSEAALKKMEDAQQAEAVKFKGMGPVLKFEDVERAELDKKAARVKPLYTQIPVRVAVGASNNHQDPSSWGSQALKYDKNNDVFMFEKYKQVIYIPIAALNEITSDDCKKGNLGQICSFYLQLPVVLVNERFEKNFKTQLSLEEAIAKTPVDKLQEVFDHSLINTKNIDRSIQIWEKITFPAQIQSSIDMLKAYRAANAYKGAFVRDDHETLKLLASIKVTPSAKIKDALDNFDSITTKYPLLSHLANFHAAKNDKEFVQALQHYITNLK